MLMKITEVNKLELLRTEVVADLTKAVATLEELAQKSESERGDAVNATRLRNKSAAVEDVIEQWSSRLVRVTRVEEAAGILAVVKMDADNAEDEAERDGLMLAHHYIARLVR